MTLPQTSETAPRTGWSRVAVTAGLLLASVLTLINSVQLARSPKQDQFSAPSMNVQALAARIDALERQVDAGKQLPKSVAQAEFDTARQVQEERLLRLEQLQATHARSDDVLALQARVSEIEARLKKAATTSHRAAAAIKPQAPEPPFSVVGVELRGGERFLTIASMGAASLSQVRLLREGETDGGWQLQTFDAHVAAFRVYDQTLRVAIP